MKVTLTKREIARDTARALALVDEIGLVTVTERGTKRWDITPHKASPADRLVVLPEYTPPAPVPPPWPDHGIGPSRTTAEVEQILDELRGDH